MNEWELSAFRKLVEAFRLREANVERIWKYKYSQVYALKSLTPGRGGGEAKEMMKLSTLPCATSAASEQLSTGALC